MEVGVRLVGITLRLLDFLLFPFFWLKGRKRRIVPPIWNPLLLLSATELAETIRNGEVLAALTFYATGSYQKIVGESKSSTMAQQTVSCAIAEVTAALNSSQMRKKYIVFPKTTQERDYIKQGFFQKFGFADVMGCIDCTHVAIVRPVTHEHRYINRKMYHSLNVQLHTSEEIVSAYIERVKEVNPYLNAVVEERYRAALDEAKAVDKQINEARSNGTLDDLLKGKPLLGVPFTVKESCSLGGMSNSVGVVENAGSRALRDGHAVSLVRAAGAIPLLVTSTPELCLGWETTNLIRGVTNNPHHLGRTPAGSSGGEAALLACGASPLSVSSDIAGSIRLPAAFTGVVGHKPTPGIISIDSHVPTLTDPAFPRLLTVGPMARRVRDVALLLDVLAGDNRDRLRLDTPVDIKDVKVFYMLEAGKSPALIPVEKCIQKAILDVVKYLKDTCGCAVSEEKFLELEDSVEISCSVFFSMKDIPNMLHDPANPKRDRSLIAEILRHIVGGARRSLQALSFELIHRTKLFIPPHRTHHYTRVAEQFTDNFTKVLGDNGVLIYPVFNEVAHYHNQVFLKASGVMYTMVFNILGVPATAVPVATHRGMPVAIQVIAGPNQDRLCLAVAREIERGFGGWKPPQ